MSSRTPFCYFKTSPEVIRLAVMLYIRFPPSLRNIEDLPHERCPEGSHETARFGQMFGAEIRERCVRGCASLAGGGISDEAFVRVNGIQRHLWRAVDHEGEVPEAFVTKRRDKVAALRFLGKLMKRHGRPGELITDRLRSYGPHCERSEP